MVIGDNVTIGDHTRVLDNSVVMDGTTIGEQVINLPNVVIYDNTQIETDVPLRRMQTGCL